MGTLNDLCMTFLKVTYRMLQGIAAWTVQMYTEVNVKKGRQFEAAGYKELADVEDLLLVTGDDPVAIKAFLVQIDGSGLQYALYKDPINPVYNPVTDEVTSYNLHKGSARTSKMKLYNCTVEDGDQGIQKTPFITVLGSTTNVGQTKTPTQDVEGLERILEPNTVYLLERTILGTSTQQRSTFYATWYEGPLDYTPEI